MTPYYQDAWVTIYHGDCRDILPIEADLCLTDPPYGINLDSSWLSALNMKRGNPPNMTDTPIVGDDQAVDLSPIYAYPKRLIWGFPYLQDSEATGWIVWDKQPGVGRRGITTPVELASTTCRTGFDIWRCMWSGYMREKGEQRYAHTTQKPLKVYRIPIAEWSEEQDVIIDPFMGSGTALRAAKDLNRKAIGIEIEEEYCEIAANRMSQEVFDFT